MTGDLGRGDATPAQSLSPIDTADDIALVAGTGLAPVGELLYVTAPFQNLLPIQVDGIDFNLDYRVNTGSFGSFGLNVNAARLIKYQVDAPAAVQAVIDGQADGTIRRATTKAGQSASARTQSRPAGSSSVTATEIITHPRMWATTLRSSTAKSPCQPVVTAPPEDRCVGSAPG